MRLLLLLFASFPAALSACTCSPSGAPACELLGHADVIFRGTVIAVEEKLKPPSTHTVRFYKFRVDRVYQGLDPKISEVLINGDSWTSCHAEYFVGRDYLMFARSRPVVRSERILVASICSGSRPALLAAAEIAFLESYRKGETRTRIFGNTLQSAGYFVSPVRPDARIAAAGAKVTLRSADAVWEQISSSDGSYSFDDLPAGSFQISAELPRFTERPVREPISIVHGGCAERSLELKPSTRISGTVVDPNGVPVPGADIRLIPRNTKGEWADGAFLAAQSNAEGRFTFENVPATDYLLGSAITFNRPPLKSALPSVYFPGVPLRAEARPIRIVPDQNLDGLRLPLPDPDPPRRIVVRIAWPGGKPPGPHLIELFANGDYAYRGHGTALVYTVPGFANRIYKLNARYWVDNIGGPMPPTGRRLSQSNTVTVQPGTDPVTVELTLGPPSVPLSLW